MTEKATPRGPLGWIARWIPVVAIVVVVIGVVWWYFCWLVPPTTIYVVRHADRPPSVDDLLVPEGTDRAEALAHALGEAGVTAIYHSNTVRTQKTAQPLADLLGLVPIEYPAPNVESLVQAILADHGGERVVVVGHSNTVPSIVEELGGPAMAHIDGGDYDNLFQVIRCPCSKDSPQFTRLKYGAETAP